MVGSTSSWKYSEGVMNLLWKEGISVRGG
jgi:hypothetical protein